MEWTVKKSELSGSVDIPASKSHTIRAVAVASMAKGVSRILAPLESADTRAALNAYRAFGADIREEPGEWTVRGLGGPPQKPADVVDVLNSGTTLYIALGAASLIDGWSFFTGDEQIRRRPVGPLLDALKPLGVKSVAAGDGGYPPIALRGPMRGGRTRVRAVTSQFVTSLLLNAPLASGDTELRVLELNEAPYVRMTLDWLDRSGVRYENDNYKNFHIPGGQAWKPFKRRIPADFSTATFFLVAAAITGSRVVLEGLDMTDSQGDKAVVDMLRAMGTRIEITRGGLSVEGRGLKGIDIDMNATPDALPAMAVAACAAEGTTRLLNVPQARLKETDRIRVMRVELEKMGAKIKELPDGLVITGSPFRGAAVHGHSDHRVVMALTLAGYIASGATIVDTVESVAVTFPNFAALMKSLGAKITISKKAK